MRVVNVRHALCTHYIGRWDPPPCGRWTGWGNPFSVEKYGRRRAIEMFREWALARQHIRDQIRALPEDAVLGCHCKPLDCHGDVIIELWRMLRENKAERS